MENNFKIGTEIKCVKNHSNGLVLKNRNYKLLGMMYMCQHYPLIFSVNNEVPVNGKLGTTYCPHCLKDSGGHWVCSTLFAILPEKTEEETESKTEYKVVEIDKSLKEKRKEVIHFN